MNKEEQINHFDTTVAKMRETLLTKGDDYAGQDNRLANFELVAQIAGVTPEIVALVLIGVKVVRLGTLLNTKGEPKNEPIRDSVLDLSNYSMLLDAILSEKDAPGHPSIPCCNKCGNELVKKGEVEGNDFSYRFWMCDSCDLEHKCPQCLKTIIWEDHRNGWYCSLCQVTKFRNGDLLKKHEPSKEKMPSL